MIKAVLFDLDGTIIDTNELIIQSFKHAFRKHFNKEISRKEISRNFGEPLINTLRKYDEKDADLLRSYYIEYNEVHHDSMVKAFEGARETMLALKERGIQVGVVTSKRTEMAKKGIQLAEIDNVLDVFLTPEHTKKHKPDPEPILVACEMLGILPEEAIYVGDTLVDINCSKAAGTISCLVAYSVLPMEELMALMPDHVVEKLLEVVEVVDQRNGK